jgi:hypothetical protein
MLIHFQIQIFILDIYFQFLLLDCLQKYFFILLLIFRLLLHHLYIH